MRAVRSENGFIGSSLIAFGLAMLAIFASIHAALIFHGHQVVSAAAQDGLRTAQPVSYTHLTLPTKA